MVGGTLSRARREDTWQLRAQGRVLAMGRFKPSHWILWLRCIQRYGKHFHLCAESQTPTELLKDAKGGSPLRPCNN